MGWTAHPSPNSLAVCLVADYSLGQDGLSDFCSCEVGVNVWVESAIALRHWAESNGEL